MHKTSVGRVKAFVVAVSIISHRSHRHHHHHHRSTLFVRCQHHHRRRATKIIMSAVDDDESNALHRYPGTAEERLQTCKNRAKGLTEDELSRDWETLVRPKLLWAAGLRDVRNVAPGKGYTGHCFNDFNHVDATTMLMQTADNEHDGSVRGMLYTRARALINNELVLFDCTHHHHHHRFYRFYMMTYRYRAWKSTRRRHPRRESSRRRAGGELVYVFVRRQPGTTSRCRSRAVSE